MRREHVIRETERYLGYRKEGADETVRELIEDCLEELLKAASFRFTVREFDLELKTEQSGQPIQPDQQEQPEIVTAAFCTSSRNLLKNLADCEKILLFAATLGAGVDKLIQRYEKIRMSRAVVIQAGAAALIEEFCDEENGRLKEEYKTAGWYLRPRFSPGYGDFPLACQKDIIASLEAGKRIGLTLTDSLLMIPSKSVTAVIGLSKIPGDCRLEGCEACEKKDCAYRRG